MKTLQDVKNEYARLDKITGANVSNLKLEVSGRLKNTLGYYQSKGRVPIKIVISKSVMEQGDIHEKDWMDIIRHEYAHACLHEFEPHIHHGHDQKFSDLCHMIGCSGTRTIKSNIQTNTEQNKYKVFCLECGCYHYYKRKCTVVKEVENGTGMYQCGRCKGKLAVEMIG